MTSNEVNVIKNAIYPDDPNKQIETLVKFIGYRNQDILLSTDFLSDNKALNIQWKQVKNIIKNYNENRLDKLAEKFAFYSLFIRDNLRIYMACEFKFKF